MSSEPDTDADFDPLARLYAHEARLRRDLGHWRHAICDPWDACTDAVLAGDPENLEQVLAKIDRRGKKIVALMYELREVRRRIDATYASYDDERRAG
jgi:hypothetical protein